RLLERPVPDGQWIETVQDALAIGLRRNGLAEPGRREAEFLQRLLIELERHRLWSVEEGQADCEILIGLVGVLEELGLHRDGHGEEGAVLDIALQLIWICSAPPHPVAFQTAEPCQRPNARPALMAHDIVGIVLVKRSAQAVGEARQSQAGAKVQQHGLEAAYISVGLQHGPAYGV